MEDLARAVVPAVPQTPPTDERRTRLAWTLQALYSSQQTLLTAATRLGEHLPFSVFRSAMNRHIAGARLRLERLKLVAKQQQVDLICDEPYLAPQDMATFCTDLAAGIAYGDVARWVLPSIYQMAVVQHGFANYARSICDELGENEAAVLLGETEAELTRLVDQLSSRPTPSATLQVA